MMKSMVRSHEYDSSSRPIDRAATEAEGVDALLRVENLDSGYGEVQVLRGITFDVASREILAIVGANGAGKSTLLRTISGLIKPTAGRILFQGAEISDQPSDRIVKLGLSQAPEGRRLFSGLSVEENLRLGAFGRADKSRKTVGDSLERVFAYFPRLRERRRQIAGTLSGGEQQMCAIGRALMANPKLLVIDELSLGLAPIIVEELVRILDEIHEGGTTIMLVEQDVSVALSVSDRAIVLQTGAVVLQGAAEELLENEDVIKSYLGG